MFGLITIFKAHGLIRPTLKYEHSNFFIFLILFELFLTLLCLIVSLMLGSHPLNAFIGLLFYLQISEYGVVLNLAEEKLFKSKRKK